MMINIYDKVQKAIITQINCYKNIWQENLPVVYQYNHGKQPKYPYITFDITDDGRPAALSSKSSVFLMDIQLKAVSDNANQAKAIGHWLRQLPFMQAPFEALTAQGVAPQSHPQTLPSNISPIINDYQFEAGCVLTLQVYDDLGDSTQNGMLDSINGKYERNEN